MSAKIGEKLSLIVTSSSFADPTCSLLFKEREAKGRGYTRQPQCQPVLVSHHFQQTIKEDTIGFFLVQK